MRNRKRNKRELVNAVLYFEKTGCRWRLLPHDFPPFAPMRSFYRRAKLPGCGSVFCTASRRKAGQEAAPAYGIIDLQSVKTTTAAQGRGIGGGKKVKGRKRHIVVMGNLLAAAAHAANAYDTKAGIHPAKRAFECYPAVKKFCGDEGYRKTFENDVAGRLGLGVGISKRIKPVFEVLPKRWVAERTFAWLNGFRRLSKDYELTASSEEINVIISHLHILLRRL